MKYKTQGGSGTGLGQNFANWLQQGLLGGGFGGNQGGASGILNDILGGGAGNLGGALSSILKTQQTNDVNSIRSRYGASGGTGFGTPAAYGEATYRTQAAPQIASAVGNLQMNALNSILPLIARIAGKDIPQASTVGEQNPFVQGLGLALPLISGLASGGLFGGGGMSPSNQGFGQGSIPGGGFSLNPNGFSPSIPNPFYH